MSKYCRSCGTWLGLWLLVLVGPALADCPAVSSASIHAVKGYHQPEVPRGETVTLDGVVTAVFLGRDQLSGFYLQAPGAVGDPLPAGLFVYAPNLERAQAARVIPGHRVQITGQADLFRGQRQLSRLRAVEPCTAPGLPEPVLLTLPSTPDRLARLEGLRVRLPQTLTVTGNYPLSRYGTLKLSVNGRLYRPTNAPGIDAEENARRRILLDDGSYRAQPRPIPYLDAQNTRRAGSRVADVTGVLAWAFGDYRVHPTESPVFVAANPRPAQPPAIEGRWRVAAFNVENYFTTLGARGAGNRRELERQQRKLLAVTTGLEADVLALTEIENNPDALADLVDLVNRRAPPGAHYAAVANPLRGNDAIKVALLYRSDRLRAMGTAHVDRDPVHSRPPLAALFQPLDGSAPFGVAAVHFKSKVGCPPRGDVDRGEGCWNRLRVQQAEALFTFLARVERTSGVAALLVAGDLNAYGAEAPVSRLRAAGLTDLIADRLPPEERYTYVFRGEAGYLDHALATPAMSERVRGIGIWHINADEPPFLAYDGLPEYHTPEPWRSSDHDPVLVGFD